jgi:hypothetical protein
MHLKSRPRVRVVADHSRFDHGSQECPACVASSLSTGDNHLCLVVLTESASDTNTHLRAGQLSETKQDVWDTLLGLWSC